MQTKQIAWNTGSGNITLTYQGQGDGHVTVQSDANDGVARSQVITIETTVGSPVVTRELTVTQGACPVPVGTVLKYAYTGKYQEVTLPAGQYKLQVWGAQGGSNAAASSYGITAQAGGKGGYSEGVITLSSPTTVRVYVGGRGSSSAGGFNGGGFTAGSSTYSAHNEQGVSRMGGGGGATDIRLSDGDLLSRMIVAGGGSGGAMCYKKIATSTTVTETINSSEYETSSLTYSSSNKKIVSSYQNNSFIVDLNKFQGGTIQLNNTYGGNSTFYVFLTAYPYEGSTNIITSSFSTFTGSATVNIPSNATHIMVGHSNDDGSGRYPESVVLSTVETSTTTSTDSEVGFVGGGTTGGGYSSTYKGKQNDAGTGGAFGQGANQTNNSYRFCSGAGGGGWYGGGGGQRSDSSMTYCKYSGGGSGFVNTAANAKFRPKGYTGLELDSGVTYDGNQSFPNTAGTRNETGHAGNGYAKITRIVVMDFSYTGAVQNATLKAGTYMIECWGAQGGSYNTTYYGGKGGYSVGELTLNEDTTVYVYVGGQGAGGTTAGEWEGGFNGGGRSYVSGSGYEAGSGGGASDVRIGQDSLYARVIVAGGGGGAGSYNSSHRYSGGAGGGVSGITPSQYNTSYKSGEGGTQTSRGTSHHYTNTDSTTYGTLADFGVGAGATPGNTYRVTGGGGGWYGGGHGGRAAGGGGSGYVYTSSTVSNYPSGCLLNSSHYLANSQTIAGNASMPSTSGGTETGHSDNGFVRITRLF